MCRFSACGYPTLGLDQQNVEQNRDLKAMRNLLAKWAVKFSALI